MRKITAIKTAIVEANFQWTYVRIYSATCHLSVAIRNFLVCEFHAHDVPFFHDLIEGGTEDWFRPGWITPLDRPGFGIELNEKAVSKYLHPQSNLFK